ncbi:MAG: NAD(+)/NADH kinase [Oscillospiraceae bacterium]|nr:NAD(+)/NADH kinase [Oscillospiraceae bacterium]
MLRATVETLVSFGMIPMLSKQDHARLGEISGCVSGDEAILLRDCDILMSVGGDGTMLNAAGDAIRVDKPLIGVNSGHVGFLAQVEPSELHELGRLMKGRYRIRKRMLIDAVVEKEGERRSFTALNDVVMRCENANRILTFNVHKDRNKLVLSQRADGIIFSTPTGSTAYSLSAGGPVVSPNLPAMLLTPICPHGTFRCSLVLTPTGTYTVTEAGEEKPGFMVSVDGCHHGCYHKVNIVRSQREIKFIDLGFRDFYKNLSEKLTSL